MMFSKEKTNEDKRGWRDKWARILFGSFLIGLVMVDAVGSWGLIGIVPLATGLVGRCGLCF